MSSDATRGLLPTAPVASIRPEPPHSLDEDGFDGRTGSLPDDHEAAGLPGDDAVALAGRTGDGPARPQALGDLPPPSPLSGNRRTRQQGRRR